MSTTTLITGWSTGFGRDTAQRLARRGHHVAATMRDVNGHNRVHREGLEALAARERLSLMVELDVTDDAVQQAVASALARFGRLVRLREIAADPQPCQGALKTPKRTRPRPAATHGCSCHVPPATIALATSSERSRAGSAPGIVPSRQATPSPDAR